MSLERDHRPAAARRLGEAELDRLAAPRSARPPAPSSIQRLDPALDLARLGRLVAEALDEALVLRDLPPLGLRPPPRAARSARRAARRSRRSRRRTRSALPSCSSATRLTTALMKSRSWLTSTIAPAYSARKPCSHSTRCQVEVVGRLVEQQQVRVLRAAAGPSATRIIQPPENSPMSRSMSASAKPRPARMRRASASSAVAAQRLEPMLEPAVLVHQLGELVLRRSASAISVSMWRMRRSMPLTAPAPASTSASDAAAAGLRPPPGGR